MPEMNQTNRRTFLRATAALGLAVPFGSLKEPQETLYRMRTPECEVRMSVQYFGNSVKNFRFRDRLSDHSFCLSASGDENQSCLEAFSGSIAIAYYHFRARPGSQPPFSLRERVLTIDHDDRMTPRPPFERALAIQREMVSDIQAFGYKRDNLSNESRDKKPDAVWSLLRQDLYLNNRTTAFAIVHWKHAPDFIRLVDVIPGDQTQLLGNE
jgi:hypothetical protein